MLHAIEDGAVATPRQILLPFELYTSENF